MQINQQIISGFIESGLNWLTEQVAGRLDLSKLTPQGQPQIQLNDSLADFIHEQMGTYPWSQDDGLEGYIDGRIGAAFNFYDWTDDPANIVGQIESVVKEELEDDLEDKVRDVFNSRSVVEDYIRDNPSSFRDSIESILRDDPSIVRDVIAQDSDIDQTLRNCLKDNPDIIRDHLESTEGRSTMRLAMESVINEAVSTRMRSIFESMSRNI